MALAVPFQALDSGFCPVPGEEVPEPRRPSLSGFVRAHAGRPEAERVLQAMHADGDGDVVTARRLLAEALSLSADPAVGLALGRRLVDTADVAGAVAALDVYLLAHPEDRNMARLRARAHVQEELQRDFLRHDRAGITLLVPPGTLDRSQSSSLLRLLDEELERAARLLDVRRRRELLAVVYHDDTDLRATTCAPLWTGGGFDGTLRLLHAPEEPDGVRTHVVRHEALHAQMSDVSRAAPGWFAEGLAQYFAAEEGAGHRQAWALMARSRTFIPFVSLEGPLSELRGNNEAALAYAQSLAMVDLLAERRGERVFAEAMRLLREGSRDGLMARLTAPSPVDEQGLLDYLARRLGSGSP